MDYEATAKRKSKDSIFADLFHILRYALQLVKALHPDTDVNENDIFFATLRPVLLNEVYNDLGLLVKDKLLILVEAQSTWTLNVLIRSLIYLADTYNGYIHRQQPKKVNVYGTRKIDFPKPEFYLIYTGKRDDCPEEITLAKDFFDDKNAAIDLKMKVICAEDENSIIGQYIIFCHVLDEQVKLHSRTKKAVEETIRICQDRNVLKEYLESRKKEVVTIMMAMFDQEYAVDAYANERYYDGLDKGRREGRNEGKIQGAVEMCKNFGASFNETVTKIASQFGLSFEDSTACVKKLWA